jgi:hypothetical protein
MPALPRPETGTENGLRQVKRTPAPRVAVARLDVPEISPAGIYAGAGQRRVNMCGSAVSIA